MIAVADTRNHFTQGDALGYRVDAPLARKNPRTKGAKPHSPGQRPGITPPTGDPSPNGAKPTRGNVWVTPRWGWEIVGRAATRGDAPGYGVDAPLARRNPCTKGAKPHSPGQRPGNLQSQLFSPERAKPNSVAREHNVRIVETIVEIIES